MQGSSVTGKNFETGTAFDVGRTSDFDVAIASPSLFKKAQAAGVKMKTGQYTFDLGEDAIAALGLADLQKKLSRLAGRDVNFRIYEDVSNIHAHGLKKNRAFIPNRSAK